MASAAQQQLDDLLDARGKLRKLRLDKENARIALNQAKTALREFAEKFEDLYTEIEQRQGRLQFDDAAPEPTSAETYKPGIPVRRKGRKARDAEGPRA
jgi:multidrug resistance efflux pump